MSLKNNLTYNTSFLSSFNISEDMLLPKALPHCAVITFMVLYISIIVLAIVGNSFVITIIGVVKRDRSVTDVYILSLALSDVMIATLNMPFQLYYIVANEWISTGKTGERLCKLVPYIQGVTIVSSVLTLLIIAVDRYVVICNDTNMTSKIHKKKAAYIAIVIIWAISLCAASPSLVYQELDIRIRTIQHGDLLLVDGVAYICSEIYPNSYGSKVYTGVIYVFLYFLPVIIMAYSYAKIVHRLWIRPSIGDMLENPLHHQRYVEPRKRIIKLMIIVYLAFTILWLPFFTFSFYAEVANSVLVSYRITLAILKLTGYINCCVNPIIYTFLNKNYQNEFLRLFCRNRVLKLTSIENTESVRKSRF